MARSRTNPLRNGLLTLSLLAALVVAGLAIIRQEPFLPPQGDAPPLQPGDTIAVASFNIQTFGETKLHTPRTVDILAQIVRRFDVVAIQEIRDKRTDVLARFVAAVNADGSHYDYLLGPAIGRTTSTERYGFVFNADRVEPDRQATFTVDDPYDQFHREPLVARFRTREAASPFTFTLVNIHTDPDEAGREVNALADLLRRLQSDDRSEDDVIVLGDLNAEPRKFGRLARVPHITWVIDGQPTNTRLTETYDNVLFDRLSTAEFTGRAGVFDFAREFRLDRDDALAISDHLPVWAEFRVQEQLQVVRTDTEETLR